jgi:hypothetical protein
MSNNFNMANYNRIDLNQPYDLKYQEMVNPPRLLLPPPPVFTIPYNGVAPTPSANTYYDVQPKEQAAYYVPKQDLHHFYISKMKPKVQPVVTPSGLIIPNPSPVLTTEGMDPKLVNDKQTSLLARKKGYADNTVSSGVNAFYNGMSIIVDKGQSSNNSLNAMMNLPTNTNLAAIQRSQEQKPKVLINTGMVQNDEEDEMDYGENFTANQTINLTNNINNNLLPNLDNRFLAAKSGDVGAMNELTALSERAQAVLPAASSSLNKTEQVVLGSLLGNNAETGYKMTTDTVNDLVHDAKTFAKYLGRHRYKYRNKSSEAIRNRPKLRREKSIEISILRNQQSLNNATNPHVQRSNLVVTNENNSQIKVQGTIGAIPNGEALKIPLESIDNTSTQVFNNNPYEESNEFIEKLSHSHELPKMSYSHELPKRMRGERTERVKTHKEVVTPLLQSLKKKRDVSLDLRREESESILKRIEQNQAERDIARAERVRKIAEKEKEFEDEVREEEKEKERYLNQHLYESNQLNSPYSLNLRRQQQERIELEEEQRKARSEQELMVKAARDIRMLEANERSAERKRQQIRPQNVKKIRLANEVVVKREELRNLDNEMDQLDKMIQRNRSKVNKAKKIEEILGLPAKIAELEMQRAYVLNKYETTKDELDDLEAEQKDESQFEGKESFTQYDTSSNDLD